MHLRDKSDSAAIVQFNGTTGLVSDPSDAAVLRRRRRVFLALNVVTIGALFAGMAYLLALGGLFFLEALMLLDYAAALPWLSIGFWNGVNGFAIAFRARNAAASVTPARAREGAAPPLAPGMFCVITPRA